MSHCGPQSDDQIGRTPQPDMSLKLRLSKWIHGLHSELPVVLCLYLFHVIGFWICVWLSSFLWFENHVDISYTKIRTASLISTPTHVLMHPFIHTSTHIKKDYGPGLKFTMCGFYMCFSWHLTLSLCPWITLSISLSLNILTPFSLTALILVCITLQHWLELSALSEQHLSCWSVEYLYNSSLYRHEVRRDKKGESITEVANIAKQNENTERTSE